MLRSKYVITIATQLIVFASNCNMTQGCIYGIGGYGCLEIHPETFGHDYQIYETLTVSSKGLRIFDILKSAEFICACVCVWTHHTHTHRENVQYLQILYVLQTRTTNVISLHFMLKQAFELWTSWAIHSSKLRGRIFFTSFLHVHTFITVSDCTSVLSFHKGWIKSN
jgi:hypothetical protein